MAYNHVEYVQNRKIDDVFYFTHLITMENFTTTVYILLWLTQIHSGASASKFIPDADI